MCSRRPVAFSSRVRVRRNPNSQRPAFRLERLRSRTASRHLARETDSTSEPKRWQVSSRLRLAAIPRCAFPRTRRIREPPSSSFPSTLPLSSAARCVPSALQSYGLHAARCRPGSPRSDRADRPGWAGSLWFYHERAEEYRSPRQCSDNSSFFRLLRGRGRLRGVCADCDGTLRGTDLIRSRDPAFRRARLRSQ